MSEPNRSEMLLEHLPDIVYLLDGEGRIVYLNPAVSVLGYEPADLAGEHFSVLIHPDDIERVARDNILGRFRGHNNLPLNAPKIFDERRSGERPTRDLIVRLIPGSHRGRSKIPEAVIVYGEVTCLGFSESGLLPTDKPGTLGIIHDVSDQIRRLEAETELNMALNLAKTEVDLYRNVLAVFDWRAELKNRQNVTMQKNMLDQLYMGLASGEGVGTLMSIVSLILNDGSRNEATGRYEIDPEIVPLLKDGQASTLKFLDTVRESHEIMINSRVYDSSFTIADLPEYLGICSLGLEPMLQLKNQTVKIGHVPAPAQNENICFDSRAMHTVFTELFINAMKYSRAGDVISVLFFLKADILEIKILNPAYPYGPNDTSAGIEDHYSSLVFEPFFRLSAISYEQYTMEVFGFGMGLAVVKRIVELHGGRVRVQNIRSNLEEESGLNVCATLSFPLLLGFQEQTTADA